MESEALVERFVNVFLSNPGAEPDDVIRRLESEDISNEVAECLLAFVPMAFAHVLLAPMGVTLPEGFKAWDPNTNESATGVLKDEPIFVAALALAAKRLERADTVAHIRAVAACSAEWQVIRKLKAECSDVDGCVLTEPLLARVPLSYFRKSRGVTARSRWSWLTRR